MSTTPHYRTELKELIKVYDYEEVAAALGVTVRSLYNYTNDKNPMAANKNVIKKISETFLKHQKGDSINKKEQPGNEPNGDYKDKYIALLEKQLEQREAQIATRKDYFDKLEEVNTNYMKMADSLQKMRQELTEVHARAQTLYVFFQHTYSHQLKKRPEKVAQDMDIVYNQVLAKQHESDSQPA